MKNLKYLLIMTGILALALTGCDSSSIKEKISEITDAASTGTTTIDTSDKGEGKTYSAESISLEDNSYEGLKITIYEDHTLTYLDADGISWQGIIITDPYNEGENYDSSTNDLIALINPYNYETRYFGGLMYLDDNYQQVSLENATSIRFINFDLEKHIADDYGDLILVAKAPCIAANSVYMLFADSKEDFESHGTSYTYDMSTGKGVIGAWWGTLPEDATSYTKLDSVGINEGYSDETYNEVDIGTFETSSFASGYGDAIDTYVVPITSTDYKMCVRDFGFDYDTISQDSFDQTITIYSNHKASWTDSNGKTWDGYYFKDFSLEKVYQADEVRNEDEETIIKEDYFWFTDGSNSKWLWKYDYFDENLLSAVNINQATAFLCIELDDEYLEKMRDKFEFEYGETYHDLAEKDLYCVETLNSDPRKIFLIYLPEEKTNGSEKISISDEHPLLYDYVEREYYLGNITEGYISSGQLEGVTIYVGAKQYNIDTSD